MEIAEGASYYYWYSGPYAKIRHPILSVSSDDFQELAESFGIHRIGPAEIFVPFGIQAGSRKAILGDIDPNKHSIDFCTSPQSRQD